MSAKTKVYLQKPWKYAEDSPYYTSLCKDPPEGIEIINPKKTGFAQSKKKINYLNSVKKLIKKTIKSIYPSMPNAHYTPSAEKYDLIHCTRCMSKNNKPWVADIEFVGQFWASTPAHTEKKYPKKKPVLDYLMSNNCKKLMAWTEWTKKGILEHFPELENKVETVYPAIKAPKFEKKKTENTVLLFNARKFYFKGGLYALEVMDKITKKLEGVEGWIVSDVPEKIKEKYSQNKNLKFLGLQKREKLMHEIYPSADIFVYPSFTDTFGFAIIEAMGFGLPVVSVDGHSRDELVEKGKTGYVVSPKAEFERKDLETTDRQEKTINELAKKTEKLIKDKELRGKMSENARKEIESGKFSIKERNKKLKRIYEEALK